MALTLAKGPNDLVKKRAKCASKEKQPGKVKMHVCRKSALSGACMHNIKNGVTVACGFGEGNPMGGPLWIRAINCVYREESKDFLL